MGSFTLRGVSSRQRDDGSLLPPSYVLLLDPGVVDGTDPISDRDRKGSIHESPTEELDYYCEGLEFLTSIT